MRERLGSLRDAVRNLADRVPFLRKAIRLRNRLRLLRLRWRYRGRTERAPGPPLVEGIELTNRCPMRCSICPRTALMKRPEGAMEFALFRRIVDEYVSLNPAGAAEKVTWLHGYGESLTHPEITRFIAYAVGRGLRAGLSVNPLLLRPDLAEEILRAGPHLIYLALDGHDDASFENIRGVKNAYGRSRDHVLRALEMKARVGSRTRLVLSMVNVSLNAESIARTREFWTAQEGLDEFYVKDFTAWNGPMPSLNRLANEPSENELLRRRSPIVVCNAIWERVTVAWDGTVLACCFDYDKIYPLGNIREQSLAEIWNGEPLRALRREFLANAVENPLCRDCPGLYSYYLRSH